MNAPLAQRADGPAGAPDQVPVELTERPVQLNGSRLALALLRAIGWQLDFDGLPARQGVLIVYPHTSNWDFPVGMLAKWAIGIPAAFWGKDSLFRIPLFGRWLSWIGGVPVDRSAPGGIVPDMVQRIRAARERDDFYWLVLAPEGTRAWRPAWRSGFYRVTVGADVPLALAHIDWGRGRDRSPSRAGEGLPSRAGGSGPARRHRRPGRGRGCSPSGRAHRPVNTLTRRTSP